jgi:hypothetical protein
MVKPIYDEQYTKPCIYCLEEKPLSEFLKKHDNYDGHDNRCRVCMRKRHKEVNELRKTAPPRPIACDCCGKEIVLSQSRKKFSLCLDHDPVKGTFRGWICRHCNTAIGLLGDNIAGVLNALKYLERK